MEKIAVIGISTLFPGSNTPAEYWQNLLAGSDLRATAGLEQMGVPPLSYYDPEKGVTDRYYCLSGGYIRDFALEPTGFSVPPGFIQGLDDIFQWSLHVAREALLDCGYLGNHGMLKRCGVVMGNLSFPTKLSNHLFLPLYRAAVEKGLSELFGTDGFELPNFSPPKAVTFENALISGYPSALVATALTLGGPSLCLDAACASSVYSVKLACDYLNSGRADMMLAGAVSAGDPFFINMGFSIFQAYPENGKSAPMDRNSDGLFAGEGAGMFVLKRYEDAVKEGDRIYAVIRGIGLSNDGKGQSVLSPGSKGQIKSYERAYENSGVSPKDVDYVECHATGTPLGDKVELDSMEAFFGGKGASPLIGSAKSNLGHLLTAAGMAGMTKVILSLNEKKIPPTINVEDPLTSDNKVITGKNIPSSLLPWPRTDSARIGAVSGFGFGGTNGHIILEGPAKTGATRIGMPETTGKTTEPHAAQSPSLAIVGMDCLFGPLNDLPAFKQSIMEGAGNLVPLPEGRWRGIEKHAGLLSSFGLENGKAPLGGYIESFDIDFLKFRIPPKEDDALIPQQLITMRVADNALAQSGIKEGANVAVIVAMGTELSLHRFRGRVNLTTQFTDAFAGTLTPEQTAPLLSAAKDSVHTEAQVNQYTSFIGNIMASRIASLWDFSGPAFSISSEENSVARAVEVAGMLLSTDQVEAVVVGAVDLSGGFENVLLRSRENPVNSGKNTLSFDRTVNGWTVGEGAGAVVLKRRDRVDIKEQRVHAVIESMGFTRGLSADSVSRAAEKAMKEAGISPSSIDYIEAHASGIREEDAAEIDGLTNAYRGAGQAPVCALGSVKASIGHTFAAAGMASLIKVALCLENASVPGTPGWNGPKLPERFLGAPFYVPKESIPWFPSKKGEKRYGAVNCMGRDQACCHMILSGEPVTDHHVYDGHVSDAPPRPALPATGAKSKGKGVIEAEARAITPDKTKGAPGEAASSGSSSGANRYDTLSRSPFTLFPLCGNSREDLSNELAKLINRLESGASPFAIANDFHDHFLVNKGMKYRAAVTGESRGELLDEIALTQRGIKKAFAKGEEWVSPKGSCFTPRPAKDEEKIAFVYPGGFNSYPGVGKDLFRLFPDLHQRIFNHTSDPEGILGNPLFFPRGMERLTDKELLGHEKTLLDHPVAMFENGVLSSVLFTTILRAYFKITPRMALGYSMGEVSMMYALGVWKNSDRMRAALNDSDLFKTRLCGPMETVRKAWNLPLPENTGDAAGEKIWFGYTLKSSPEKVREALSGEERAYLLFVNTPNEVVIAGDEKACGRVIKELGCPSVPAPLGDAIHCEPVKEDYRALVELHRYPAQRVEEIDFYSSASLSTLDIASDSIAKNIADVYSSTVDFRKLVEKTHDDGAEIFIELGPRDNCTGWIGEILSGKKHLAVGIDRKGVCNKKSLVKLLARLYCHRVPMDLSPLFSSPTRKTPDKKSLIRPITTCGSDMGSLLLSEKIKDTFGEKPRGTISPTATSSTTAFSRSTETASAMVTALDDPGKGLPEKKAPQKNTNRNRPAPSRPDNNNSVRKKHIKASDKTMKSNGSQFGAFVPPHGPDAETAFDRNISRITSGHRAFLENRTNALKEMGELIKLQVEIASTEGTTGSTDEKRSSAPSGLLSSASGETCSSTGSHTAAAGHPSISSVSEKNRRYPGNIPPDEQAFIPDSKPGMERRIDPPANRKPVKTTAGPADTMGKMHQGASPAGDSPPKAHLRKLPPAMDMSSPEKEVIWDREDLLEFAEGDIEKVFGPEYRIIDTYNRRVRLPMEDYLLVSRVTKIDAVRGELKPSTMTTEYDIPVDAAYTIDGQIPWAVAVESGQCDLLLISYLGVDFTNKGERVYRLLDCTLTFMDHIAMEGDTLRYDISINNFAKNGDSLLFFFSYDCYVGERLVLKMRGGCAGFFTDEELAAGKGIIDSSGSGGSGSGDEAKSEKGSFTPLLSCKKSAFDSRDLLHIVEGNPSACFGPSYNQNGQNPSLRFATGRMLMLDRVLSMEPSGGKWGLGKITAEKDLAPDHWYFPCHFKDDQVMAGSLMSEGCGQLLQFYLLHMGMQTLTSDARFQPIAELPQKVRCRGQVTPKETLLTYILQIKEVGTEPFPYAIADIDIVCAGKIVVDFKDLGVRIVEKRAGDPIPGSALLSPAKDRLSGSSFESLPGNEGRSTRSRRGISSAESLSGSEGVSQTASPQERDHASLAASEGASAVATNGANVPEILFDQYHLTEFATGSLANCFGPSYRVYENRQPPRTPNGDLQLISRVLSVSGRKLDFKTPATVVSEYDVPVDAWYFTENNHPGIMPYSVIMEIALQPCGFISTWAETTLIAPETDFYFRNLDGAGKLLSRPDLRGKTITNRSVLLTTVATGNTIIQKFTFELSCDGELFYEGTAVFGYFVKAALTHQLGLDGGIDNHPLTEKKYLKDETVRHIDLKSLGAATGLYAKDKDRPFYRLAGKQLDFIDEVRIVPCGGRFGKGYIYAHKKIDPSDWFYPCHFHNDPVMPGSLGVEAILEAIQVFALDQNLGDQLNSPCFIHPTQTVTWKYRGQIIPSNAQMTLEIHIKDIVNTPGRTTITGDASLWKETIRIYEVTDIALCLTES